MLDGLHSHGITVVLQLVGAPAWANGGRPANYAPTSATTFARLRHRRRDPVLVGQALADLERAEPGALAAADERRRSTRHACSIPRTLAIHRAISGAQVAGGGTAPRGSSGGVSPVAWLTGMRAAHARLDAYAHNPYPLDPKRETPLQRRLRNCTTITMATINKLVVARRRGTSRARASG